MRSNLYHLAICVRQIFEGTICLKTALKIADRHLHFLGLARQGQEIAAVLKENGCVAIPLEPQGYDHVLARAQSKRADGFMGA